MVPAITSKLWHSRFGQCELVRIEGTDWIVQIQSSGVRYRIPPDKRSQFAVHQEPPPVLPAIVDLQAIGSKPTVGRHARRIIESLRIGLPSLDGSSRHLAVGLEEITKLIVQFLRDDVATDGGGALTLLGHYGQGKTFALQILEETARESGFMTARTEIDASENQLNKPHHIYRDLMKNLRLPFATSHGARGIVEKVQALLAREQVGDCYKRRQWLATHLDCPPLEWLLSDPFMLDKPELIGLFEGDPNYPASRARERHRIPIPAQIWPAFNVGSQGDFGSFLLSGIGRLSRLLGYKGFLIIMDEMEKWHELNWHEQMRAGNLLGGLVWAATARHGRRGKDDHPNNLTHSIRCGGYPFSTSRRCHIGLAVAMTPRGDESEHIWAEFGPVLVGSVPRLNPQMLSEYSRRVLPYFADAYGLKTPTDDGLQSITDQALHTWTMEGDLNTRSGVQAVIAAFDRWRYGM
jgi:hypothetical protein